MYSMEGGEIFATNTKEPKFVGGLRVVYIPYFHSQCTEKCCMRETLNI